METLKYGILAIIQGITELLPISSSGHLLLTSNILGIELDTFLLTVLHLGTTLAIILFLRKTLFKNLFTKEKLNFYLKILVASIPAGVVGILFQDYIEETLRAEWIIGVSLIVWGVVMVIAEQRIKTRKDESDDKKGMELENVGWKQSIFMGIAQTFALIPGTSRSGITTLAGIFTGLDKYVALEYSFILGLPVLLGSSLLGIGKEMLAIEGLTPTIFGLAIVKMLPSVLLTFVVGYIALMVVRKYQKKNWLTVFGIYRVILGILVLIVVL